MTATLSEWKLRVAEAAASPSYVEVGVMIKFEVGGRGKLLPLSHGRTQRKLMTVAVAFLCRKKKYVRRRLICIVSQVADVPDSFVYSIS